ncbi:hypothetical protein [Ensifer sp.]|jgi:hypothetical protein|uniref:hypothetical protein n=1 Tax=Ensifer sp. TaxID=1872086 RepID=UPI002E16333D|nr:hypothetical protein [Ensifer sp.]
MGRMTIDEYVSERTKRYSSSLLAELGVALAKSSMYRREADGRVTIDSDKADALIANEAVLRAANSHRVFLNDGRDARNAGGESRVTTTIAVLSMLAAFLAAGLTTYSNKIAGDALKSTLAATDAKNRYEVQILVANKLTEAAMASADELTNRLFDFNSAFVIANDLHEDGGFVNGWQAFISRYCRRLKDENFFKDVDDPLADTRAICEKNTQ